MLLAWESKSSKENNKFIENLAGKLLWKKDTLKAEGDLRYVELSRFRN
jgi:hypothetical protein